jgi:hypothetical protein
MKDRATIAATRERFREAAELYAQIAQHEPDGDWLQRAGDAARRGGLIAKAVEHLSAACSMYASRGFEQKAIALAKVVLQLDPAHQGVPALLRYLDSTSHTMSTRHQIATRHTIPTR